MQATGFADLALTLLCFVVNGIISEIPPKSVNLAIETSFLIEPQDLKQNFSGLSNLQNFLDKIQNQLYPNKERPVFRSKNSDQPRVTIFDLSEFVQELGVLLLNYEEDDLRNLSLALKEAVKFWSKDAKFNAIFSNNIKTMLKNKTRQLADADPLRIKVEISKYITRKEVETTPFSDFIRKLSKLLKYHPILKALLNNFKMAEETKVFTKPIDNAFRYFIYEWDKMDYISKLKLGELLAKLSGDNERDLKLPKRRSINATIDSSESLQDNSSFSDNSFNIETVLELDKNVQFSLSSNFISNRTKDVGDKKQRKDRRVTDEVTFVIPKR